MARNFFSLNMSIVFEVKSKLKDSHAKFEDALQRMVTPVSLLHLQNDCIIPVFRDNEKTVSHYEFVDAIDFCCQQFFKGSQILDPE
ncbi:MAG: DUF3871 family protein, partial [Eubacteriaceae bacterium]|nr:DUF3871 family protein [Eubacteriaceae bacterium]